MSIRAIGGSQGVKLVTTCKVLAGHQDAIAVGKFVQWDTNDNWQINSCADAATVLDKGIVKWINDVSSIATVEWIGFNKIHKLPYSATPTLGHMGETETANGTKVTSSSNATAAVYQVVVAYDVPDSGYVYIASV